MLPERSPRRPEAPAYAFPSRPPPLLTALDPNLLVLSLRGPSAPRTPAHAQRRLPKESLHVLARLTARGTQLIVRRHHHEAEDRLGGDVEDRVRAHLERDRERREALREQPHKPAVPHNFQCPALRANKHADTEFAVGLMSSVSQSRGGSIHMGRRLTDRRSSSRW